SNAWYRMAARPSIARAARNKPSWASNAGVDAMRKIGLFAFLLACAAATGAAAEYPHHPIRFIVPQAAGSATDTMARLIGAELSQELGQQVIIDDRPGGALTIGLDLIAK